MNPPIDEGTKRIRVEAQGLRVLSFDLVVIDGPSRGTRVHVGGGMARVGSAPGNHLALADDTVSRVHCELRAQTDAVLVKDCGSTNGTLVEGVRIREGEVKPGTAVRAGNSSPRRFSRETEERTEGASTPTAASSRISSATGTGPGAKRPYAP
jgi:pSer/pThr/pTyr-binding forkhead associated (FHA) protein